MAFRLDAVVPWGRSFEEYVRMFALDAADLGGRILGCGDGPASFNAEATEGGADVVSVDPLYRYEVEPIRARIDETFAVVLEQARTNRDNFVWDAIPDVEALGRIRMEAMARFLDDYPAGREAGRYVEAALPELPFPDRSFDLALCSHFLFLYSGHLSETFHLDAIRAMARVAGEVRVFPLLTLEATPSPYVTPVVETLRAEGFDVSLRTVPYEFQRGGNRMLVTGCARRH